MAPTKTSEALTLIRVHHLSGWVRAVAVPAVKQPQLGLGRRDEREPDGAAAAAGADVIY